MDLKTIRKQFPHEQTEVGFFSADGIYYFQSPEQVEGIEDWNENPFYCDRNTIGFLEHIGGDQYKSWFFGFDRVVGYSTKGDENDFFLITYNSDIGYELIDPQQNDPHTVIIAPAPESNGVTIGQILQRFKELYPECGELFVNGEELADFIDGLEDKGV